MLSISGIILQQTAHYIEIGKITHTRMYTYICIFIYGKFISKFILSLKT